MRGTSGRKAGAKPGSGNKKGPSKESIRRGIEHRNLRCQIYNEAKAMPTWGLAKGHALKAGFLSEREERAAKFDRSKKKKKSMLLSLTRQRVAGRVRSDRPTPEERTYMAMTDDDLPMFHTMAPRTKKRPRKKEAVSHPDGLTPEQIARARALIEAAEYKRDHPREFPPEFYDWQHNFFDAEELQVMLMAANRTGKTFTAGFKGGCDLTLSYPDWWRGPKMDHPLTAIALGVDNTQLRRVVQKELFGEVEDRKFAGGWVHKDEIASVVWNPVVPGLAQEVMVKCHNSDDQKSVLSLRAYTQAKTGASTLPFAGTSIDWAWIDECPPDALVGQLTVRTATGRKGRGGIIRYTLTPELGVTGLIQNFTEHPGKNQRLIGPVTWEQCPHLTPEVIESVLEGIPEHERDMRSRGIPFFGAGLIYPFAEDRYMTDQFEVPPYYRVLRAMDLGIRHPTAIVWLAYDTDTDTVYVVKDYAVSKESAAVHASAANSMWPDSPVVLPPDVDTVEKGTGESVRAFYRQAGLKNGIVFRNPDGSRLVAPGIMEIEQRIRDGRLQFFPNCNHLLKEMRLYHRDEKGRIVKENDDCLDALRYGVMMLRYAVPLGQGFRRKPTVKRAMAKRGY